MARPTKLAAELAEEICQRIRRGCFPAVAAESCGLGKTTFYRWMQEGRSRKARKRYREFREQVLRAGAEARVAVECRLFRDDPFTWLRCGPGRTDWGNKADMSVAISNAPESSTALTACGSDPVEKFGRFLTLLENRGLLRQPDGGEAACGSAEMEERSEI
jgi:hypothetical protein